MVKKILYIDDQRKDREKFRRILQELPNKIELILANDGLDGLTKFRHEKPDLVMLEIILPKLHGFQLCKVIQSSTNDNGKQPPILILTGTLNKAKYEIEARKKYNIEEFIAKPFTNEQLIHILEKYI